jgi:hypothetical protein
MEKEGFFADPKMKLLIFTEQPFTTRNAEGASFFSDVRRCAHSQDKIAWSRRRVRALNRPKASQ